MFLNLFLPLCTSSPLPPLLLSFPSPLPFLRQPISITVSIQTLTWKLLFWPLGPGALFNHNCNWHPYLKTVFLDSEAWCPLQSQFQFKPSFENCVFCLWSVVPFSITVSSETLTWKTAFLALGKTAHHHSTHAQTFENNINMSGFCISSWSGPIKKYQFAIISRAESSCGFRNAQRRRPHFKNDMGCRMVAIPTSMLVPLGFLSYILFLFVSASFFMSYYSLTPSLFTCWYPLPFLWFLLHIIFILFVSSSPFPFFFIS